VNHGHTEAARSFEVEGAIVNEDALFGPPLRNGKRHTEDAFFGFTGMDVAGAEENLEAAAKIKSFDAVLIELERFVIYGADKIAIGGNALIEYGSDSGKFLRLGKHEGGELFAGEFSRAIEESAIEVVVEGELARVESRERKFVTVLKVVPVEMKGFAGFLAGVAVPTISENDAANIPKQSSDASHEQFPPAKRRANPQRKDFTAISR
jgi:hypothetical protein